MKKVFSCDEMDNLRMLVGRELQRPFYLKENNLTQSPSDPYYYYFAQFTVSDFTVKALTGRNYSHASHLEIFFKNKCIFTLYPNNITGTNLNDFNEPELEHHQSFQKLLEACDLHYQKTHSLDYLIQHFSIDLYSNHENQDLKDATIQLKPSLSANKETLSCILTFPTNQSIILQKNGHKGNYNQKSTSEWVQTFHTDFEYPISMKDKKRLNIFNPEMDNIMDQMKSFKEVNKNHRNCEITIQHGKVQTVKIRNKVYFQR